MIEIPETLTWGQMTPEQRAVVTWWFAMDLKFECCCKPPGKDKEGDWWPSGKIGDNDPDNLTWYGAAQKGLIHESWRFRLVRS